ncbi:hypothetical protein [Arthrobacter sp. Y81]|uniref:hypothetical protein n=1 Tax=Arthrobacter sp. Y81 TaxID=2058897 RepID=UPI000CE41222|nr:hypothetical protein [Arthrobacter sp. Y81]
MPLLRGEQHPHHRLTADDVLSIRASYIPGVNTLADLARCHHVSKQTISVILQGKTWSHLEGTHL